MGLWHASKMIEHLRAIEPDLVVRTLNDLEAMIEEQRRRVQTQFGLRDARKPKAE